MYFSINLTKQDIPNVNTTWCGLKHGVGQRATEVLRYIPCFQVHDDSNSMNTFYFYFIKYIFNPIKILF